MLKEPVWEKKLREISKQGFCCDMESFYDIPLSCADLMSVKMFVFKL